MSCTSELMMSYTFIRTSSVAALSLACPSSPGFLRNYQALLHDHSVTFNVLRWTAEQSPKKHGRLGMTEIRMRNYVLRLFRNNGEPTLIYRTQDEGDDWVLARLLRIRSVQYD